jgi:hypothetical protein
MAGTSSWQERLHGRNVFMARRLTHLRRAQMLAAPAERYVHASSIVPCPALPLM